MGDRDDYEDYRNTLGEIVDGGGCMETTAAAAQLREEGGPSRRELLGSDALATGVSESVDDVLAGVDTEAARERLRAGYDDIDDVRETLRETVAPGLFDALAQAGVDVDWEDFALDPPVCLKTFSEADLDQALTLVPHVHEGGVVGRIVTRATVEGRVVTLHAIPEWGRSYAVFDRDGGRTLVTPDGTTADCTDADERVTGLDCDPERAARTEYVQTVRALEGTDYVVETACTTV